MFKKGDLVRLKSKDNKFNIKLYTLYIIDRYYIATGIHKNISMVVLNEFFNNPSPTGGYYSHRFKKVTRKDMTEEEKFEYIKFKLGAKS